VDEYPASRINEERIGQLAETKVDDFAEKRVDLDIRTGHSLDVAIHEYGQALGNDQSYSSHNSRSLTKRKSSHIWGVQVEAMIRIFRPDWEELNVKLSERRTNSKITDRPNRKSKRKLGYLTSKCELVLLCAF